MHNFVKDWFQIYGTDLFVIWMFPINGLTVRSGHCSLEVDVRMSASFTLYMKIPV